MYGFCYVVEAYAGAIEFGGPLHGSAESAESLVLTLQEWGLGGPDEAPRRQWSQRYDEVARRGLSKLIQPPGTLGPGRQKFVCCFFVGLEDDDEFCLVKRILGKAGCNMRRIADDCDAKVRLRGIGSGFLEGSDATEANMPLQLNISCTDYMDYVAAVDQAARLLKDLYKHYRRYARSRQMEPPDVELHVEEVRRDDLNLDLFAPKVPSMLRGGEFMEEADSATMRARRQWQVVQRAEAAALPEDLLNLEPAVEGLKTQDEADASQRRLDADGSGNNVDGTQQVQAAQYPWAQDILRQGHCSDSSSSGGFPSTSTPEALDSSRRTVKSRGFGPAFGSVDDTWRPPTLPSGAPMPSTPAGRRAAARQGGAEAAAIASAAAYAAFRAEREERMRVQLQAKMSKRNAPRGAFLPKKFGGDAQQRLPDGQVPIGAHGAQCLVASKGCGKGKGPRRRGGRNRGQGGSKKDKFSREIDGSGLLRPELDEPLDHGTVLEMQPLSWPAASGATWMRKPPALTLGSLSGQGEHIELPLTSSNVEEPQDLWATRLPMAENIDSKLRLNFEVE